MKTSYYVKGMMCTGCTNTVEKSLRELKGIESVSVNLASETATINFDETQVSENIIADTVKKAGYELELPDRTASSVFRISGMHCSGCVGNVESTLLRLNGVIKATVNLSSEKAFIEYDPSFIDVEDLKKAIENAGFKVSSENGTVSNKLEKKEKGKRKR